MSQVELVGTQEVVEELLRFVDREVVPIEERFRGDLDDPRRTYAPDGRLSAHIIELIRSVRQAAARAGFFTAALPSELGGGGLGPVAQFAMWEALYYRCGPNRLLPYETLAHFATGPSSVLLQLQPSQKAALSELMSGEASLCFALSEPDAGSDAWAIRTRAELQGGEWVLNGTKQWITNGAHADYALVFAVTDPSRAKSHNGGITCFLVNTAAAGFGVDSVIRLFGHIGGHEAILRFTDLHVPPSAVVGAVDEGFAVGLEAIATGRLYNCARAVGLSRWAIDVATRYAKERVAFGHPISDYQAIQWLLADSAIETYAARTMSLDCAARMERGSSVVKELAMSKVFATEAGNRTIDRCSQVLGAMGLTNEVGLFDAWQQIRIVRIAEGSGEILRRTIARQLLKGDMSL